MRVGLLGPLVVTGDDGVESRVPGAAKERAVLAVLALKAPRTVSLSELVDAVWGEDPPRTAEKALQTYVSGLRRALSPGAIETVGGGYRLAVAAEDVDVAVFEQRLREASQALAANDGRKAAAAAVEALGLWRGQPLGELAEQPAGRAEVTRLVELRHSGEELLADARLALGEHAGMVGDLESAVAAEPLRERRWAQLMLALYRAGRQADALRSYHRLRTVLGEELGIDPSAELRALEAAILAQDPALSLPVAAGLVGPAAGRVPPSTGTFPGSETEGSTELPRPVGAERDVRELTAHTLTFVFTDIEGSTELLRRLGEAAYAQVLADHHRLIRAGLAAHDGREVGTQGDGFFALFSSPRACVAAVIEMQRSMEAYSWPGAERVRVRMGVHTGEAAETGDGLVGLDVHRAARVAQMAHGGQILVSETAAALVRDSLPPGAALRDLGTHHLKGLGRAEPIFQLDAEGLQVEFPPLRSSGGTTLRSWPAGAATSQKRDLEALPVGTVTLLFSDVAGSPRRWELEPNAMSVAMARHDQITEETVTGRGGVVVRARGEGDSRLAVFARASDATGAALELAVRLGGERWSTSVPLRVRMAIHTGEVELRAGDYYGSSVNRCAGLRAIAHPGQILVSQASAALARDSLPAGAALVDLGWHRFKDVTHPDRVFELTHPDIYSEFPPLVSLDARSQNLPMQPTSFIGREREVTEVCGLLVSGRQRLVTLTGVGGTGKTRVALQCAAELLDGSFEGVWLVELASLSDPDLVANSLASVLGVRDEGGRSPLDMVVDAIADRDLLVVLDNCEHVVDSVAKLVEVVLRSCSRVHLLATSREPLGVEGEHIYRVLTMAVPPSDTVDVNTLGDCDAVRLFVERGAAQRPGFALDEANARAVAQVCTRLDGIPLALELAAARLGSLSPAEIASRLDQRFGLLTRRGRTGLGRQQTLRAMIDWSYDLLNPHEQLVFERLSVFAGGWTLDAAEQVVAGGDIEDWHVLDHLSALVDKSLVQADQGDNRTRYRLLETIRHYAAERLVARGPDEIERVRLAHRDFYLELAERAAPALHGPDQLSWLDRLEADHDNLRAALAASLASPDPEPGLRIAAAMDWFWTNRGYLGEGCAALDAVLDRTNGFEPSGAQARVLAAAAQALRRTGDYGRSEARAEEARRLAEQLGDGAVQADALATIGWIALMRGNLEEGLGHAEAAVALATAVEDPRILAYALISRQIIRAELGDIDGARADSDEAIRVLRDTGDYSQLARALHNRASDEVTAGHMAEARVFRDEAREIALRFRNQYLLNFSWELVGWMSLLEGDLEAARTAFTDALAAARQSGNRQLLVACLLGVAVATTEDLQPSANLHGLADLLAERLGHSYDTLASRLRAASHSRLRAEMGDEAFKDSYDHGRRLNEAQGVALAYRSVIDSKRSDEQGTGG
jgi:predicted ATPase/class 3 adenylate cyclase/DNA-binding SARP family transcriptional activator